MVKNNLIRKLLFTGATAAAASGIFGCGDKGIVEPKPNNPPRVELSVSPTSGISPLEIRILGRCTDPDGQNDIADYRVMSGSQVLTTANPTDITYTLTENAAISSECSDRKGERATAGPINIQVLQQGFSQTAQVVNDVDVQYRASLNNISEANLEVKNQPRDSLLFIRTITTPSYTETFQGIPKGDNYFILKAQSLKPDTVRANIQNFFPEADFTGLNLNLNEGDTLTVNLPQATDKNPEDNPVQYTSVKSLDGKVSPALNGNELKIQGLEEFTGLYRIELNYGNLEGGLVKDTIPGNLFDLAHLVGRIEDARTNSLELRTDLGEDAKIRVYNAADSIFLKEALTDSQGNFDFKLDRPGISEILFQARIDKAVPTGLVSGYVRTIKLPGRDTTGLLIRAYPYNEVLYNAGISRLSSNFRKHLEEINPDFLKSKVDSVEIINVDPLGRGSFTPEYMELVKNKILNPNDIGCYVDPVERGRPLHVQVDSPATPDSMKHYEVRQSGDGYDIFPDSGWAIMTRNITLNAGGATRRIDDYRFNVEIKNQAEVVAAHEVGHGFLGPLHALTLTETQTIMREGVITRTTPGPADCEAGKVIYEETFKPGEFYKNILGLEFLP